MAHFRRWQLFDSLIFATWPKGLYLAKQLSEEGKKIAYVEILPRLKSPFGVFLDESLQTEKEFLESIGFLFRQEGGFCLLSPQGVWPLQEMWGMEDRLPVLKNKLEVHSFKDFGNHWLSYLSLNLSSKVFEYNNSEFSDKSLNLFSDYFLFEPSFKKIEQFQKNHSALSFYQISIKDLVYDKQSRQFLVQEEALTAEEYFFLVGCQEPFLESKKWPDPYWQWRACFFETDFGSYEDTIPPHFVSIKNLFLPWSHENLFSVFHKKNQLEVWMRTPYKQNEKLFIEGAKEHLKGCFPGCNFSSIEKPSPKALIVYGRNGLSAQKQALEKGVYIENLNDFFQGDLASEIQAERRFFDNLQRKREKT